MAGNDRLAADADTASGSVDFVVDAVAAVDAVDAAGVDTDVDVGTDRPFAPTRLDALLLWAQSSSLAPYWMATSCCRVELEAAAGARFGLDRLGCGLPHHAPAQADLLIVAGTITQRMVPMLGKIHAQMLEPKWVMAIGACAISGGAYDNYATVRGVEDVLPVDVYVPGCPPRPDAILDGLLKLRARIRSGAGSRERSGGPLPK